MDELTLVLLAALPAAWALVAPKFERSPLTGPLFMTVAGAALGPNGAGWIDLDLDAQSVRSVLTLTLIIVLFGDAAKVDIDGLRRERSIPLRLLLIGLPLVIVATALTAAGVHTNLDVWAAIVLATALAPTDAALGLAVVENKRVPARIRLGLNVESGLNDGLAVPLFVLAIAGAEGDYSTIGSAVSTILSLIGIALAVGVAVGGVGAWLLEQSAVAKWSSPSWRSAATPLLALIAYGGAEALGGSGFVAAFVAGLALAAVAGDKVEELTSGGEVVGHLLTLVSFLVFGAAVLGPVLTDISTRTVVFGVLCLTLARMIPVALSLIGTGFAPRTVAFMGWFGPRGLASIIFAAELASEAEFDGADEVAAIIVLTVALSVVAHGMTAAPLSERYADWSEARRQGNQPEPEHEPVESTRSSRRLTLDADH